MSSIWGEAWDGLKQGAGDVVNEGAQALGDGLNTVGLHGAAQYVETEGDKVGYALGGDVGELQLGQSGDPRELIHGDAAAIRSAADHLSTFRNGFGAVADGLSRIETGHWEGAAADAFRAKFAPEPRKWGDAATGHGTGPRPTPPGAFTDPGEALREEARQVLGSARQERNTAASATAAVRNATGLAPKEPSFLDQLGADASDTLKAGTLANASLGAGVLEGIAGIGKFARTLNPTDVWNMKHPVEYAAGISGTLAGLVNADLNPVAAVKGLLGSGWGSDPAKALGKLIPGVALAVVSDGGGAAADTAEAAGGLSAADPALSAVSRDVTDGAGPGDSLAGDNPAMTREGDPVDVATGDVVLSQTDVSLPGALPLVLKRVHRSSQKGGRWFGGAWVSGLDQRLAVMADRIVCLLSGGQALVYRRAEVEGADSSVLPVAGPSWGLTRAGDGTFSVTDTQRGLTWTFGAHPAYWRDESGAGEFPLASMRDLAGHVISFEYGDAGEPVSVTHSGGYQVTVTVTGSRVTRLALGDTPLVTYGYDEAGQLTEIVNSSGQPLRMAYDDAGRVAGYADRTATAYAYTYDADGRCVRGESPSGALSATYEYRDGQTFWTDATGAVTTYTMDRSARITAVTDPLGGVTRYDRDARGRVTSETDPLGRITRYAYDEAGNTVSVTRPDGETARAVYDEWVRRWSCGRRGAPFGIRNLMILGI